MIEFFNSLGDFIGSLVEFILKLIADLLWLIQTLPVTAASIPDYLFWLPSAITSAIIAMVSIAIIFKILGRE